MLDRGRIEELFRLLDDRLRTEGVVGEVSLVGGAVMCLAFSAGPSTADLDAVFAPAVTVRRAARAVAADAGVDEGWLNDAAKGYLSDRGEFTPWLELEHLKVYVPVPEYL